MMVQRFVFRDGAYGDLVERRTDGWVRLVGPWIPDPAGWWFSEALLFRRCARVVVTRRSDHSSPSGPAAS